MEVEDGVVCPTPSVAVPTPRPPVVPLLVRSGKRVWNHYFPELPGLVKECPFKARDRGIFVP